MRTFLLAHNQIAATLGTAMKIMQIALLNDASVLINIAEQAFVRVGDELLARPNKTKSFSILQRDRMWS